MTPQTVGELGRRAGAGLLQSAELLEAAPFRRSAELEALKGRALDRAAEVLLDYERRIATAGSVLRPLGAMTLLDRPIRAAAQ